MTRVEYLRREILPQHAILDPRAQHRPLRVVKTEVRGVEDGAGGVDLAHRRQSQGVTRRKKGGSPSERMI